MKKVEVYLCDDGGLEKDIKRAVARNIEHLMSNANEVNKINFSCALQIVERALQLRIILDEYIEHQSQNKVQL